MFLHSQAALPFHFTTLIHPQESEEATPEMSFRVSMSVSGGGTVLARIITAWGSRLPRPRWWFIFFGAGQSARMVRSLGIVGGPSARSPMLVRIGGVGHNHCSFLSPAVLGPAVSVGRSIGGGWNCVRGPRGRSSGGRGPTGLR